MGQEHGHHEVLRVHGGRGRREAEPRPQTSHEIGLWNLLEEPLLVEHKSYGFSIKASGIVPSTLKNS